MTNALFQHGKDELLKGNIDLLTDTIRCYAVDLSVISKAVTDASGTPINIVSAAHGSLAGDLVMVTGVQGNTAANRVGVIKQETKGPNNFEMLAEKDGSNTVSSGAYTGGGRIVNLTALENLDDIPNNSGDRLGSFDLDNKALAGGMLNAEIGTLSGVGAGTAIDTLVICKVGGSEATSPLLAILTGGFSLTTTGDDATVVWNTHGVMHFLS